MYVCMYADVFPLYIYCACHVGISFTFSNELMRAAWTAYQEMVYLAILIEREEHQENRWLSLCQQPICIWCGLWTTGIPRMSSQGLISIATTELHQHLENLEVLIFFPHEKGKAFNRLDKNITVATLSYSQGSSCPLNSTDTWIML